MSNLTEDQKKVIDKMVEIVAHLWGLTLSECMLLCFIAFNTDFLLFLIILLCSIIVKLCTIYGASYLIREGLKDLE